jgi:hypothetical protein
MALLPGSPAIDAGDNTAAPLFDQRGPSYARIVNARTDIGAFEVQFTPAFVVSTAADAGPGSLRQAILDANANSAGSTITFDLPGTGMHTIALSSTLPAITAPVVIDGAGQPDYNGRPLIALDGSAAGSGANGLTLTAGNSTVIGLVIHSFAGTGILLEDNGGNVIEGNYLGTDASGEVALPNAHGVYVTGYLVDNTIGGSGPGAGNLISGNLQDGIGIDGGTGNTIQGNFIGTDASGTKALPNGYGVELFSGSFNTIGGGSTDGAGNVISGNLYDGIGIYSDGNVIQGNHIGTDVSGTHPLGNGRDGVAILAFQYGYNNLLGGTDPGAGNVIAFNGGHGVRVTTGTGDAVRQNAIYGNAAGGIGLFSGANQHQHTPVLISAVWVNGTTTITGTVAGRPGETLTLDFFDNPVRTRQGESFLGSLSVTIGVDGQGDFVFQVSGGVNLGDFVTATATDAAGNTSRFSKPVQVTGTDIAAANLNGAAVLTGLTSTVSPAVRSADDPGSTVSRPLSQEVSTSPAVPSGATALRLSITTAPHAADAVFAGWDTVPDGLALNWR